MLPINLQSIKKYKNPYKEFNPKLQDDKFHSLSDTQGLWGEVIIAALKDVEL